MIAGHLTAAVTLLHYGIAQKTDTMVVGIEICFVYFPKYKSPLNLPNKVQRFCTFLMLEIVIKIRCMFQGLILSLKHSLYSLFLTWDDRKSIKYKLFTKCKARFLLCPSAWHYVRSPLSPGIQNPLFQFALVCVGVLRPTPTTYKQVVHLLKILLSSWQSMSRGVSSFSVVFEF